MNKSKPTEAQLEALKGFGIAPPNTRKYCAAIIDWIKHGGSETGKRIAIMKDGQSWVGKKIKEKDGSMTGMVLFVLPKTPESLLQPCRADAAKHAYSHPLDARVKRDSDGKAVIVSVGRIEVVLESTATTIAIGEKGIAQVGDTEDGEDGGIIRV